MTLFCYEATTLAEKEIGAAECKKRHWWQQETPRAAAELRRHLYKCQALQATGKEQMAWLLRASKGNKHRNGREKLATKRENFLDPFGSLFAVNTEKNQSLVSVTLSPTGSYSQCCMAPTGCKQAHTTTSREASARQTAKGKGTRLCPRNSFYKVSDTHSPVISERF